MKNWLIISSLLLSTASFANENIERVGSIITTEDISLDQFSMLSGHSNGGAGDGGQTGRSTPPRKPSPKPTPAPTPELPTPPSPEPTPTPAPAPEPTPSSTFGEKVETTGKVISTMKEMVALGEAIYEIVNKGKPSNVTEYAPISVVPRDPISKEYVDPFDLENFSMPVEKNYTTKIKSTSGKDLVVFTYKVMYSYGGTFNGTGKYLTNVQIIPSSVKTSFGWDFNATMRLSGIMNHGSKENPVAGAIVAIKYQMNNWTSAYERNDTIHITGNGQLKNYSAGTK